MKNINTYFNNFEKGKVLIDFDICLDNEEENIDYEDFYNFLYQEELDSFNNHNSYIIIASLGLWNDRQFGYKIVDNLTELSFHDYITIYKYRGEMIIKDSHHDGINYLLVRKIKDNFDTYDVDKKFNKHIYENKCKLENLINYYTEKLDLLVI